VFHWNSAPWAISGRYGNWWQRDEDVWTTADCRGVDCAGVWSPLQSGTSRSLKTSSLKAGNTVTEFIHKVSVVRLGTQNIFDRNE